MNESNCLFMSRVLFDELGGYEEAFDVPGGGFVNLDFWARACELPSSALLTLAGEASFHQFHGGAATGIDEEALDEKLAEWGRQFARIRGREFRPPERKPRLMGEVPRQALPWIRTSAIRAMESAPAGADVDVDPSRERTNTLESQLAGILTSRSWRLTAPLRRLWALFRRTR